MDKVEIAEWINSHYEALHCPYKKIDTMSIHEMLSMSLGLNVIFIILILVLLFLNDQLVSEVIAR